MSIMMRIRSFYKAQIIRIIIIILSFSTFACTGEQRYVVRDYIPASQININNFALLKERAFSGEPTSQFEYGRLFFDGLGVRKSRKEAFYWWTKSAENGNPDAQYALGIQYYNGLGINADFNEGCKWLKAAASLGHRLAQEEVIAKCTR